ncbi:aldose epimerase family protein [Hydrogenophaga sp.]|uniref:aldose epimerase family protein n=1 Tax=Hydrogenophaga sp. TaxID=1904254 RepID=UPI00356800F6
MASTPYPHLLDPARFVGQVNGQATALFLLRNARGMVVAVTNLGAKVLQIVVPDRHGKAGDVALGYDSLEAVLRGSPSMGAFIGRYAGRIAQAGFTLGGTDYRLGANAGPHCIHGGPNGSRHQVFDAQQPGPDTLHLQRRFDSAGDGFPGSLELRLVYHLSDANELVIGYEATASAGTSPASFTSHIFFNLDGPGLDRIDAHQLQVRAQALLLTDADKVCTGQRTALDGHALDLRHARRLGDLPDLDHAYVVPPAAPDEALPCIAHLYSPNSGRTLEVCSTEPVLQVYGADALGVGERPDIGKNGVHHRPRAGLCLEPQQYPNAPNCPAFPLPCVTPERPYRGKTVYRFGVAG